MQTVLFTKNPDAYISCFSPCHIVTKPEQLAEFVMVSQPGLILVDRTVSQPLPLFPEFPDYTPTVIFATESVLLQYLSNHYKEELSAEFYRLPAKINRMLDAALLQFYFTPSFKGYHYIKQALYYQYLNSREISAVKKDIYEAVSCCYKTTVYSVERGITFAIRKAFTENRQLFRTIFPNVKKQPSNMAFLKTFFIYLEQKGYL